MEEAIEGILCFFIDRMELSVDVDEDLDLPIPQFLQLTKSTKSVIRLALDIGGGTGTLQHSEAAKCDC
ncbi:hypothetical protein HAX54_016769 [Datura stramonium]|uniref:Uncharacterized protein n=1 Tax=Datura stramonium TaxID=4076 RepID=A0ABS8UL03_DATST|nr:hypothetical protein [Datura stramonium]